MTKQIKNFSYETILKRIAIFTLILLLCACAGTMRQVPYEEPITGPMSKIRIADSGTSASFATFVEPSTCTDRRMIFVGVSGISDFTTIPAEQDFAFAVYANRGTYSWCEFAGIFKPVDGAQYEFDTAHTKKQCVLTLYRIEPEKHSKNFVDFKVMKFKTGWVESSSWCSEPDEKDS